MIGQPEHPLRPAFEKAREWAREQERQLTEQQRLVHDALRHRQAKELKSQKERLDRVRAELAEGDKRRKPKPELALKPPVRVADPQTRRLARLAIAHEKRLERLEQRHQTEAINALKKFEQERAKANDKSLSSSWLKAVSKAASHEADRSPEKARDQTKDIERSR